VASAWLTRPLDDRPDCLLAPAGYRTSEPGLVKVTVLEELLGMGPSRHCEFGSELDEVRNRAHNLKARGKFLAQNE
jgi:hypothetical protein